MAASEAKLALIPPDKIRANPDNPRLIFREAEMAALLESISTVGIQVPLTVYASHNHYVLLDGERRWRCARKLNLAEVPAIVQPKPSRLENILNMFNIHNVRVDWDPLPMALKLAEVKKMLEADGRSSTPKDLAGITGVSLNAVKRAFEILALPAKYRKLLMREAEKPRDQQAVTADLFLEINKVRQTIKKYVPQVFDEVSEPQFVDSLVNKYKTGVIRNVVGVRDISKIARAERAGKRGDDVRPVLVKLSKDRYYSISQAYKDTVEGAYQARDLGSRAQSLLERLRELPKGYRLNERFKDSLVELRAEIDRLLGD
ncbi:MAG: ParB/RepB/Spo0J family partition protein [Phycisphaerales bacterium]|nr:ParB/RepB/Spo0J family partition protein [Phycisphaerales bacterium]